MRRYATAIGGVLSAVSMVGFGFVTHNRGLAIVFFILAGVTAITALASMRQVRRDAKPEV